MALNLADLKSHCNVTDGHDDQLLARLLGAASTRAERVLGFKLDDDVEFPDGTPADVENAIYMLAAHWYENREASLVGVSAQELPYGVGDTLANHRRYTFGLGTSHVE